MRGWEERVARWTRRFGNRRGTWQLVEAIRQFSIEGASADTWQEILDFDGDLRFKFNKADLIGSQIFWRGSYSPGELRLLGSHLRPDMVFLDVGANIGEFSVFAAKRLTSGRVIAFEPAEPLWKVLCDNLSGNGFSNYRSFNCALDHQPGRRPLYRPPSNNLGATSLHPIPGRGESMGDVEVRTLDDVVDELGLHRLDIVKIDVEGSELGVLKGGSLAIQRHRPVILLELNRSTLLAAGCRQEEIAGWLMEWGYSLRVVQWDGSTLPLRTDPLPDFCNLICHPIR